MPVLRKKRPVPHDPDYFTFSGDGTLYVQGSGEVRFTHSEITPGLLLVKASMPFTLKGPIRGAVTLTTTLNMSAKANADLLRALGKRVELCWDAIQKV